ncbi:E3 ubiquitin-protein ligase RNF180 [Lepisosteus oculatus]|uniref:E3 ubiquitin-protein ligase RNF180 n=1 Tax=Lepisosteus oculatus TaxID=7918 RepID=UPI00371A7B73
MERRAAVLRCRRCRKCILGSTSLLLKINASDDDLTQCNIWHVNVEALPDWIQGCIEDAQWTIGKLNCLYCGARLGGFNFVGSAKCPCGLDVTVHLCKSRVDYESKHSLPISRPARTRATHPGHGSLRSQVAQQGMEASQTEPSSTSFSRGANASNEPGRIAEALCLEARSQEGNVKAIHSKVFSSVPCPVSTPHILKASHRKAHSLDYSNKCGMGISTSFSNLLKTHTGDPAQSGRLHGVVPASSFCAGLQLATGTTPEPVLQNLQSSYVDCETSVPSQHDPVAMSARGDNLRESTLLPGNHNASRISSVRRRMPSQSSTEEEDVEEEQAMSAGNLLLSGPSTSLVAERRLSKKERNRLKSLRRKQRRRERWIQSQLQDQKQSSTWNLSSSDDEDSHNGDKDGYICAVCLDVYFSPYMCYPCHHIFCEPCLRTLAKNNPGNTPCPLCRTVITHVFFQKELNHTTKTFFPKEYLSRKQNFQKASCAKWPLPSCRKLFHIFGGLRRQTSPIARRQFPHGGYRLDTMDYEDDSRGWRFDMDMVIIYIYSVNWVIGFIIFCLLCYFFFPSF